jgi:hypothetical protein
MLWRREGQEDVSQQKHTEDSHEKGSFHRFRARMDGRNVIQKQPKTRTINKICLNTTHKTAKCWTSTPSIYIFATLLAPRKG